jgi:hypothetical protein
MREVKLHFFGFGVKSDVALKVSLFVDLPSGAA